MRGVRARRVVVTGIGVVSPLGCGVSRVWHAVTRSQSGLRPCSIPNAPVRMVAPVPREGDGAFDFSQVRSKERDLPLYTQYALHAAAQAVDDAQLKLPAASPEEGERYGVAIGSGIGGLSEIVAGYETLKEKGPRRLSPYFIPNFLVNIPAGLVALAYGLRGPNHATSTACTTSAHALGDAMRFITHGDADVMLAGGTEACLHPLALHGFARMRALSQAAGTDASRPFDAARDGFVMGEGAAVLVLEERGRALSRGARIYAELAGYGLSADAHHLTAPPADGAGAERSMRAALRDAGESGEAVGYVNAHATSTPLGDEAEARAVRRVCGAGRTSLRVSSTKGATGHLLGAAGAIEAAFTALALHHRLVPPTLNLRTVAPGCEDLDLVPQEARPAPDLRVALTNSFGFGGTNASLVLVRHDA